MYRQLDAKNRRMSTAVWADGYNASSKVRQNGEIIILNTIFLNKKYFYVIKIVKHVFLQYFQADYP